MNQKISAIFRELFSGSGKDLKGIMILKDGRFTEVPVNQNPLSRLVAFLKTLF
ncbi:hypothetical protein [Rubrolithibacter danxiaensis]|uniref:hypothetical protein n=1 Tax=Rubrolithibacter danxiaensis TaxID=3390805 RepID=UPI003BF88DE3